MINMQPVPDGRSRRKPDLGRPVQHLLLDRSGKHVIAAVFMTQVLPFADHRSLRIYRQFERGVYAAVKAH